MLDWIYRAFERADETQSCVLGKARLWDRQKKLTLNDRLRRIINRLADGFDGKFTSSKWTVIAKCSPDTALRDIEDFRKRGILTKDLGGGRAIHCLSPELPKQALHQSCTSIKRWATRWGHLSS